MSDADKHKAIVHWMDTLKERLDHYEVHRNEFLSDMRLPPRNVKFLREVLLPFCENTLLLDNIAKSEGLCYWKNGTENRLRIIVRVEHEGKLEEVVTTYPSDLVDVNGKNDINYPNNFPYLLQHKSYKPGHGETKEENTLTEALNGRTPSQKDLEICLPNEHVIYSILENLIRNSAKHNAGKFKPLNDVNASGLDTLKIHVDITDAGADYYHCTIYDNVSQVGLDKLTALLNKKKQPLLQDGRPNRDNMGMADMKINAFLLKSGKDFTENDLNEALDIVICDRCTDGRHEHAVVRLDEEGTVKKYTWKDGVGVEVEDGTPNGKGSYLFGYRFKLTKAKKVAWIGKGVEDDQRAALSHHGIRVFPTWGDYCTGRKGSLAAYTFSVVDDLNWKEAWKELEASKGVDPLDRLGLRVMLNGEFNGHVSEYRVVRGSWRLPKPNEDCVRDFMEGLWASWMAGVFGVKEGSPAKVYAYWDMAEVRKSWQDALGGLRGNITAAVLEQGADRDGDGFISLAQHLDRRSVVLDHHGRAFKALACHLKPDSQDRIDETDWKEFMVKKGAYYFTDKSSSDHDAMVHIEKHGKDLSQWFAELLDAWFTPVVVLDERIAERSGQRADGNAIVQGGINRGLYAAGNVFAVTDLQLPGLDELTFPMVGTLLRLCLDFDSNGKAQLLWSKPGAPPWNVLDDFPKPILLAHRTHLDQVLTVAKEPALRKIFRDVFVTSGGGRPHGASKGFKFVPWGIWEGYIGKSLSKLALMRVLSGLTR